MRLGSEEENYKRTISGIFRNRNLFALDILIVIFSYFISIMLIHNIYESIDILLKNVAAVVFTAAAFTGMLAAFSLYRTMWVLGGTKDYIRLANACVIASVISVAFNILFARDLYFKFSLCAVILISFLMIAMRMGVRAIHNLYAERVTAGKNRKRLMIVGAGSSAAILLKDMANNMHLNYDVVCFIDDDPNKKNAMVNGIRVVGNRYDIVSTAKELHIDEILLAIPSASVKERKKIIEICNETECRIKTLPSIDMIIDESDIYSKIRNVQIEDLLAREPIHLDNTEIKEYIEDKVILITGGGGSIGSELCRQVMRYNPKKLVVLDVYGCTTKGRTNNSIMKRRNY